MSWQTGGVSSRGWWDADPRRARTPAGRHRTSRGQPLDILAEETIQYRDVQGRLQRMRARVTPEDPSDDPFYLTRLVIDVDTLEEYVQKRVHGAGRRPATTSSVSAPLDGIDALDNEIQIGLHLVDTFGDETYPRELSRVFGYYRDDAEREPFVLIVERGRPVDNFAGRLLLDQVERFPASLLRALEWLDVARVVHRCLTATTVRFDDRHVQITDFRHAVLAGERCGPAPVPQWAAPEALDGLSPASPKEDVYSVGVLFQRVMAAGAGAARGGVGSRRGNEGPRLLEHMSQYYPDDRPTATEALNVFGARRDGPSPTPRRSTTLTAPRFVEGQRRFELIRRRRSTGGEAHGGR